MMHFGEDLEFPDYKKFSSDSDLQKRVIQLSEKVEELSLSAIIIELEEIKKEVETDFAQEEKILNALDLNQEIKLQHQIFHSKYLVTYENFLTKIQKEKSIDRPTIRIMRKLIISRFLEHTRNMDHEFVQSFQKADE